MSYVENLPNAGKLIQSLRHVGYSNTNAIADIVDNSLDAEAQNVHINIIKAKNNDIHITIIDDGRGMDMEKLSEALRLGSDTERDADSDLGKFGMGLCTASLSMCKKLEVLTKTKDGNVLYSAQDVDEVVKENKFVKSLAKADAVMVDLFDTITRKASTGTIVFLSKTDHLENQNIEIFANLLKKEIGRIFRYYIFAGKKFYVCNELVGPNDPLLRDEKETQLYSDDEYDLNFPDIKLKEKIRIIISILPPKSKELNAMLKINEGNQGFYILRNNREIASGKTLGIFTRDNHLNRMRIELLFSGNLDEQMGVNFAKQNITPNQVVIDKIKQEIAGQIISIRRVLTAKEGQIEGNNISHDDAEKVIARKSKLLIVPEAIIEKRSPRVPQDPNRPDKPTDDKDVERVNIRRIHTSRKGLGCRFDLVHLGVSGAVYECFQEGKVIVVEYNVDHPFYQRMILDMKGNQNVLNSVDYLMFAMASAELKVINDENVGVVNNIKSIMGANLRTLLS